MAQLPDFLIQNSIRIEPFAYSQYQAGVISYGVTSYGYDLRLGTRFKVFDPEWAGVIDPKNIDPSSFIDHEGITCVVPAHGFVLGESVEYLEIPRDILAICVGKSTYARCGIIANVTPLEPEWRGRVTIEISNTTPRPARVYANEGIIQVIFLRADQACKVSYADKKGKYQDQTGIELPKN